MQEFKKILQNKNFIALWISQILSQLTINILSFVIIIHLFNETGSSIATSLLWVAYAIPAIIIGPIAAASVDFVDKRWVLVFTNLFQAITVFAYAILLYKNFIFLPYAIVFVFSFLNQFYVPAEAATLPAVVPKERLTEANGIFFITQQSSLVLGFGLAGILNKIFGFRATVLAMAILLIVAFISVTFLPKGKPTTKLAKDFEDKISEFFGEIVEGYKFIKNNRRIFLPFILLLSLEVIIAVIVTNLPRIAVDVLLTDAANSGIYAVLPAGLGAVAGTVLISKILSRGFGKRRLITWCLALFAFGIGIATLILPLISIDIVRIILGGVIFVGVGFAVVGILVPTITYLQENTPKELLGRVFGNFWFLTTLVTVLPVLFSATVVDILGIRWLLLFMSALSVGTLIVSRREIAKL